MNRLLKRIAALILIMAVVCTVGCKKADEPNNGENNGNNGGNGGETPEAPAIVSTSEVQYNGTVYIETVFDDETKMYFEILSPNEVALVNGEFYYQDNPSLAYKYRGEVVIPERITHFGVSYDVVEISKRAFNVNYLVTSVYIPNSVKALKNCKKFEDGGFTYGGTFESCCNLNYVHLSENIQYVGTCAFAGCPCFKESISLPDRINQIEDFAFDTYSDNIVNTIITCPVIIPPVLGHGVFEGRNIQIINVPASSVEAYKTADGWSQYADVIVGI